jgi:hypothetical protein
MRTIALVVLLAGITRCEELSKPAPAAPNAETQLAVVNLENRILRMQLDFMAINAEIKRLTTDMDTQCGAGKEATKNPKTERYECTPKKAQ